MSLFSRFLLWLLRRQSEIVSVNVVTAGDMEKMFNQMIARRPAATSIEVLREAYEERLLQ